MLKNGRIYIYTLLALLIVFFNIIYEYIEGTFDEAFKETLVIFPLTLVFVLLVYLIRQKLLELPFIIKKTQNKTQKHIYLTFLILFKSILFSLLSKLVTHIFINEEPEDPFLDILILPMFLGSLVIILFIYFFEDYLATVNQKHQYEIKFSQYESEKTIAKYLSLKKQLNPHFLFNSFNSLISLISIHPLKAEKFVEELSSIYRYNLSKSDEIVVSLKNELEMIESYIHLQKIRFGDSLIYKESIDPKKSNLLLPPMTLQLLVENAIKHNVINTLYPLCIDIYTENNFVVVSNNIHLKNNNSSSSSLGIGLNNLKKQIELIANKKVYIKTHSKKYIVYIPLIDREFNDD